MSIGSKIKANRERISYSQVELAKAVGVSHGCISHWENGTTKPRMAMVEKLSGVFRVPVSELVNETTRELTQDEIREFDQEDRLINAFNRLSPEMKEAAIAAVRGMAGM